MKFNCPKWIVFQVTEKCNLRCKMCYEWGDTGSYFAKKDLLELDIDVMENIITDLAQSQSPFYELFGGEPLMYSNLERLLCALKNHNCKVDIPTNGTLLKKYANLLVENQVRGLWVSIDGKKEVNDMQRGEGVFEKAVAGIEEVYRIKKEKKKEYPLLGVTMVVTPLNYQGIESFFLKEFNSTMLDYISIEFQLYTTKSRFKDYSDFINREFNITQESGASGLIRDIQDFKDIEINSLISQMTNLRKFCADNDINLIGYPKTMTIENLSNFYTGQWDKMVEKRNSCSFPWLYLEISANGNVTPCHTFYDLHVGNVYEQSILDIWNGNKISEFRNKMKGKVMPICCSCSRYYSHS